MIKPIRTRVWWGRVGLWQYRIYFPGGGSLGGFFIESEAEARRKLRKHLRQYEV